MKPVSSLIITDLLIAAGVVVFGFGLTGRRRILLFAGASLLLFTVALRWQTVWEAGLEGVAHVVLAVVLAALVFVPEPDRAPGLGLTQLFGTRRARSTMRSRYERQLRAAAGQEERNRLARDLHDSVKQQIYAIQTQAATAQELFTRDQETARAAIGQVRQTAADAMREMEAMLDQLRAEPLENSTLVSALRKQCDALQLRTGGRVDFSTGVLPANEDVLPGTHEALFRIAQEALANVARHARAANTRVRLDSVGRQFVLTVTDDGAGFDTNQPDRGMGRANMRTRAEEVGGTIEVQSAPGAGTTVIASVPLKRPKLEIPRHPVWAAALLVVAIAIMLATAKMSASVAVAFLATRLLWLWYRERVNP